MDHVLQNPAVDVPTHAASRRHMLERKVGTGIDCSGKRSRHPRATGLIHAEAELGIRASGTYSCSRVHMRAAVHSQAWIECSAFLVTPKQLQPTLLRNKHLQWFPQKQTSAMLTFPSCVRIFLCLNGEPTAVIKRNCAIVIFNDMHIHMQNAHRLCYCQGRLDQSICNALHKYVTLPGARYQAAALLTDLDATEKSC